MAAASKDGRGAFLIVTAHSWKLTRTSPFFVTVIRTKAAAGLLELRTGLRNRAGSFDTEFGAGTSKQRENICLWGRDLPLK